ncbi:uncharacterized protein LOC111343333 [Stylophora pistillata]|uniref:uncharacterized protein LOC111343333 n=1 Tax=Stylophora pistillata TaxID=50429 RepID=UPI000C043803|nr:uncharacterized protein LOC111343333 [Stylophora pistillata]
MASAEKEKPANLQNKRSDVLEVVNENLRDENQNVHTSGLTNFPRYLVDVYNTTKKNGFTVDYQPGEDVCGNYSDAEHDSNSEKQATKERFVLKKTNSSKGGELCASSMSANRTSRSYLYEKNPLQDPRFTRLIEKLVPLRRGIQAERKTAARKEDFSDDCDDICFKDICLKDTCRLVFKIMSKGSSPSME